MCKCGTCQNIVASNEYRYERSKSRKGFFILTDGNKLSSTRRATMRYSSARLSTKVANDETEYFENQSIVCIDFSNFVIRIYGCGMCDEMFEVEKEFMEQCFHH